MARHRFTQAERRRGGQTTARLAPPALCPRCGPRTFKNWLAYIGHLGLHTFADRYAGGDLHLAAHKLNLVGLAVQDPFPRNGAFREAQQVADQIRKKPRPAHLGSPLRDAAPLTAKGD